MTQVTDQGTRGESATAAAANGARTMTITETAARRVAELSRAEGDDSLMLRVFVNGGGCSGFQYGFSFDDTVKSDDHVFEREIDAGSVKVVVDETSLDLLAGSEIDWVEELVGAAFRINNPNATASCGCGSSFAI